MRIFKNRWFARWAKKNKITDEVLKQAAADIASGIVEANIGNFLYKKRLARKGEGKRGGYRIIVGYKKPDSERIIFLYAFEKSHKSNITPKEKLFLSVAAEAVILATDKKLKELLKEKIIEEVCYE